MTYGSILVTRSERSPQREQEHSLSMLVLELHKYLLVLKPQMAQLIVVRVLILLNCPEQLLSPSQEKVCNPIH